MNESIIILKEEMADTKDNLFHNGKLTKLLKKIAKKDVTALEHLYQQTSFAVFGLALSILKNYSKAEDVMQDVYIKIFEKADTYQEFGKPMSWIFTITRNLCLMEFRKKDNAMLTLDDMDIPEEKDDISQVEDKILLTKLMGELNVEERQIVTMHVLSGLKHKEIAAILNLPLSTVLSKYNRSIKKLQQGGDN